MFRSRVLPGFVLLILVLAVFSYQPDAPAQEPEGKDQVMHPEHLFPLNQRKRTFRFTDGEKLDERLQLSLHRAPDEKPGQWVLEFSDLSTIYLSVDAGRVMIKRLDLLPEGRAVEYDPPVRMLPAEIRPDVRIEEVSKAKIYDLETGELERKGTVRHEVQFASRSSFTTDVGVFEGYRIPIEQEINVPWASVRLELTGGYVPEVGLVYRRVDYTQSTLGFFGETIRQTAVLAEELSEETEETK